MDRRRKRLRFASYNSRGFNKEKAAFIHELMSEHCDILLLQEHWRFEEDIPSMSAMIGDVNVFGTSGMPSDRLVLGRPYGGCAVVVNKTLQCRVEPLQCSNRRLFSFILTLSDETKLLMHSIYMPVDTEYDRDNLNEYISVLYDIDACNILHDDIDCAIIGGDLNTDVARHTSLHSKALVDFCETRSFSLCFNLDVSTIEYTYVNEATGSKSVIDHFLVTQNLIGRVRKYFTIEEGHNLSDHIPLLIHFDFEAADASSTRRRYKAKPRWTRANAQQKEAYRAELHRLLAAVQLPFETLACTEHRCEAHTQQLSDYYEALVQSCLAAAQRTIPCGKSHLRAGWKEYVSPFQERSKFWHKIWIECQRPEQGLVYDLMKKAKADYKRVSKWLIRNQEAMAAERMADALLTDASRDFWSEVKQKCRGGSQIPNTVDDAVGDSDICEMFYEKYEQLYSCVSYETEEMDDLKSDVDQLIAQKCLSGDCYFSHRIYAPNIARAIQKLKAGKSDARDSLSSDHFLHAPPELHVHLSLLLNAMLAHTLSPSGMLLSVLIPIPKDKKKSLSCSDNYRSIALSSIVGKILDNVILSQHAEVLVTSPLQFGFKRFHSTTQCSFILEEIIHQYTRSNGAVFCMLLDASRAFDRVHYIKLFRLLITHGLCPTVCKLLLCMYTNQELILSK